MRIALVATNKRAWERRFGVISASTADTSLPVLSDSAFKIIAKRMIWK
jgi:hypothetical protein